MARPRRDDKLIGMPDSTWDRIVAAVDAQYRIEHEIGRGGMSIVYRARDERLGRSVAIKVLPPELAHDPAVRTRFAREAHTSAQLSHPNIVPIHDVGDKGGIAYLVMGLVEGTNLAALLARNPRPPVDDVRRILAEVADALAYAHERGVIHRDIKPDNILIDSDSGRVMVTDFGIARAMEVGARLTQTGIAVGTPAYMSPEQATGERLVDGRSDVYSLGVVGYQMLTGRVPFRAANAMALLLKHVTEQPRDIAELRPDVPRGLRETIERALAKSPDDRWPTAAVMGEALRSDETPAGSWRLDRPEPVRYVSPNPDTPNASRVARGRGQSGRWGPSPGQRTPAASRPQGKVAALDGPPPIVLEPEHLAALTPEQRADLRLWHGRVNLLDRIKAMRGYAWLTAAAIVAGLGTLGAGLSEGIPPAVFAPLVPMYMSWKLWRRGKSLQRAGVRLRRVLLMPRAKWVLPAPPPAATEEQLEKLVPRHVLDGPHGDAIRRAVDDRTTILLILQSLSKADRAMVTDVAPTVDALVLRVANLALMSERVEQGIDPELAGDLQRRLWAIRSEPESPERDRRLAFLARQQGALDAMVKQRETIAHQIESAGLALGTLRLDLMRLRSSGLQSVLSDVTSATQQARVVSRDIGVVLEAAEEVKAE